MLSGSLFSAKKTQIALARDRGFDIGNEAKFLNADDDHDFVAHFSALASEKKIAFPKPVTGTKSRASTVVDFRETLSRLYPRQSIPSQDQKGQEVSIKESDNETKNTSGIVNAKDTPLRPAQEITTVAKTDEKSTERSGLLVYWATPTAATTQISINVVAEFLHHIDTHKPEQAIMIAELPLSSQAEKAMSNFYTTYIQFFMDAELIVNPTLHSFYSRHEPLNVEETRKFLKDSRSKLPQQLLLRKDDTIVRYLGLRPGTVVRIYRTRKYLETPTDLIITYRVVAST